ncbi:GntR family transcriptional regulator [Clostridium tarantellae]|uniref:GntR family transcriptional regulator n=1 Tax=Clostridium tarantellae TaxID=39493 RepID=A0A6I1MNZ0_9CLOT|nr:GntR family transcriptional regulator [Clostridium tarantellae]MPQ44660.1 GntR family transcriptional regulator [Clostridium tarantellae]
MIKIDARSSTPIYEQIIIGVKEAILKGLINPGEKLPSVREMASMLMTNPNTVSKAYGELERLKVIETLRGKGTFISSDYKPHIQEDRMESLKESLKNIVLEAKYMGLTKEDILRIMDAFYKELDNKEDSEG